MIPGILARALSHSRYGFPQPILRPRTALERLRALSWTERYDRLSRGNRAAVAIYTYVAYPLSSIQATFRALRQIQQESPSTGLTEAWRIYAHALLRNIPPVEYALYGFHDPSRRRNAAHYLYWTDTPALLLLNRLRGARNDDVQDKVQFAHICQNHDLAHVCILAEFRGGRQLSGAPLQNLPFREFWVKSIDRSNLHGAECWTCDGDGTYVSGATRLTAKQWEAHLRGRDCMVQQKIRNHPEVDQITNGAVAVLRLNTAMSTSGNATLLGAGVSLPVGTQQSTRNGIGCSLDPVSGKILRAVHPFLNLSGGHPDTGEALIGSGMPFWSQAAELTLRAHREAFPLFASLGWDVVVTADGPLLLEANSGWSMIGQQREMGPLGASALAPIIAQALEKLA